MNPKDQLATPLGEALMASGNRYSPKNVVISQRCRQLRYRLEGKGLHPVPLPLIDAVALRATDRTIARLATRPDVGYIENNAAVRILMDIARETIGVSGRRDGGGAMSCLTGRGVTIGIVDTGIDPHPDFGRRIRAFADMVNEKTDPYDDHGHGTMCAGCAAGDGLISGGQYRGVAPAANIVAVKSMDAEGGGTLTSVLQGLQWVSDHKNKHNIKVLSLSIGVEIKDKRDSLVRAVEALWTQGIFVVAAAGNSGPKPGSINSPGRAKSILTVGAIDDRNNIMTVPEFSSRGPVAGAKKPDLLAPGVELVTTKGREYGLFTGTSAATPVVAGCAALLLEKHPHWSPDRIKQHLLDCAREVTHNPDEEGRGVIHMENDIYRW